MNKKIILIILLGLVFIGSAVFYFKYKKNTEIKNENIQNRQAEVEDIKKMVENVDLNNYENAKFGYSLKFPNQYFIFQERTDGEEGLVAASLESEGIFIGKEKDADDFIFSIAIDDNQDMLSESLLEEEFTDEEDPQAVSVSKINFAGLDGFKVIMSDEASVDSFDYYFLKLANGKTAEVTVATTDVIANQILASLKFAE